MMTTPNSATSPPNGGVGYQDEGDVNLRIPYVFGSSRPRDLSYLDFLPAKLRVYNTRLRCVRSKEEPTLSDYLRQLRSTFANQRAPRDRSVDSASRYYVFGSSTPRDLSYLERIPWEYRIYDVKLGWRQRKGDKRSKTISFSSSGSAGNSRHGRRASSLSPSPNSKREHGGRLVSSTHGRVATTGPGKVTRLSPVNKSGPASQGSHKATKTKPKSPAGNHTRSVSNVRDRSSVTAPISIQCPPTPTSSTLPSHEFATFDACSPLSDEFYVIPTIALRPDTDAGLTEQNFEEAEEKHEASGREEMSKDSLNASSQSILDMATGTARDVINAAEMQAIEVMKEVGQPYKDPDQSAVIEGEATVKETREIKPTGNGEVEHHNQDAPSQVVLEQVSVVNEGRVEPVAAAAPREVDIRPEDQSILTLVNDGLVETGTTVPNIDSRPDDHPIGPEAVSKDQSNEPVSPATPIHKQAHHDELMESNKATYGAPKNESTPFEIINQQGDIQQEEYKYHTQVKIIEHLVPMEELPDLGDQNHPDEDNGKETERTNHIIDVKNGQGEQIPVDTSPDDQTMDQPVHAYKPIHSLFYDSTGLNEYWLNQPNHKDHEGDGSPDI